MRSKEQNTEYARRYRARKLAQNPNYNKEIYRRYKSIRIANSKDWYRRNYIGSFGGKMQCLLNKAKQRAKMRGIEFSITLEDLPHTNVCPLLGTKLEFNNGRRDKRSSPSIDRIDPALGYVPGNVWVISARANQIKNDATLDELKMIVDGLERRSNG